MTKITNGVILVTMNDKGSNGDSKELLDALISKQKSLNLRDHQFARLLGIGRSTWTLTKSGKLPIPRNKIVAGVLTSFPELQPILIKYQKSLISID